MAQYFKGDDTEKKFEGSVKPSLDTVGTQLDNFESDAYNCQELGRVIYEDERSPLAKAIDLEIFKQSFNEVFNNFVVAGSFESYIAVFEKIFGATVDITFTIPASGRLQIDIIAQEIEESEFVAREIVNDEYVFYTIVDDVGDTIVFQNIKGFQSQYELEQMLYEMVPDGIFTEISLSLGA